jgi:hypothetical protein
VQERNRVSGREVGWRGTLAGIATLERRRFRPFGADKYLYATRSPGLRPGLSSLAPSGRGSVKRWGVFDLVRMPKETGSQDNVYEAWPESCERRGDDALRLDGGVRRRF